MEIPLALEGLTIDEIDLVCDVFRSGQLTMGRRVKIFEEEFAEKFGAKFAVMVNSGSSANLLGMEVFRNRNRGVDLNELYIAVPAVLWPTSLWPIVQLGFKALVIDTLPGTLQMDLEELLRAKEYYGQRLVGAVIIHPLGKSLDLSQIEALKNDQNFFILEDNCESIGAGNGGKYAGTVGDFGTYSFYYSHHMTTVEGGMITTNDEAYANDLLSMRAHGWTRNRMDKQHIEAFHPNLSKEFLFVTPGYNFRPMEFQGALGSSQLKKLDDFIASRTDNAFKIYSALKGSSLSLIGAETFDRYPIRDHLPGPVAHSWMALPITSLTEGLNVENIRHELGNLGVATRPLLAGDFTSQPAGTYPGVEVYGELSNSKDIYSKSFMIGNHHNYTSAQVEYLTEKLLEVQH